MLKLYYLPDDKRSHGIKLFAEFCEIPLDSVPLDSKLQKDKELQKKLR